MTHPHARPNYTRGKLVVLSIIGLGLMLGMTAYVLRKVLPMKPPMRPGTVPAQTVPAQTVPVVLG